jgi:hypothetical protein
MSALARGIVLQKDGEKLVIQATEQQVVDFALGSKVSVAGPPTRTNAAWFSLHDDPILYNRHGDAVAYVQQLQMIYSHIDVTSFADTSGVYTDGRHHYEIRAEGPVHG